MQPTIETFFPLLLVQLDCLERWGDLYQYIHNMQCTSPSRSFLSPYHRKISSMLCHNQPSRSFHFQTVQSNFCYFYEEKITSCNFGLSLPHALRPPPQGRQWWRWWHSTPTTRPLTTRRCATTSCGSRRATRPPTCSTSTQSEETSSPPSPPCCWTER